jgi:hypothetical protein
MTATRPAAESEKVLFACPVCDTPNGGEEICRVCDTDLGPLHRFEALPALLLEEGRERLEAGDPAGALLPLSAAVALDPERPDARRTLDAAYQKQGLQGAAGARSNEAGHPRADIGPQDRSTASPWVRGRWRALRWDQLLLGCVLGLLAGVIGLSRPTASPPSAPATPATRILAMHPALASLGLEAVERHGNLAITGRVPSELHRELAAALASRPGVAVDVSGIEVAPPAPESATAEAATSATHVVQRGDTLSEIARLRYGEARLWREIAAANGITDPDRLAVGGELVLPPVVLNAH